MEKNESMRVECRDLALVHATRMGPDKETRQ